ncbi:MAG: DUF2948 family protein [Hellea sp.]|nr:DUF2948 family protein [Hellea sp.]
MARLKLKAEKISDLKVIASAVQDSILRTSDIKFFRGGRYMNFRLLRFLNESDSSARAQSALRVDGVISVRSRGIKKTDDNIMAVLLDVNFTKTQSPGGFINFIFANQIEIQVEVECIDILLADLTNAKKTNKIPKH